jgi:general nucleoside transport system permease protein
MSARLGQAWSVAALPIISIGLSFVVGSIVIILSEWLVAGALRPGLAIDAFESLIGGAFGSFNAIIRTLAAATPLILGGLSVGLAFKAGLFNIGATGQYLMGALGAVIVGIAFRDSPPIVAIPAALAAGMFFGAVYGFIPGILKALSGAHEVVTTIMLNYIAAYTIAAVVSGPLRVPASPQPQTLEVGNASLPILAGDRGHIGILIAVIMVGLYGWLLYRTTFGFEIRTAGANPDAARYAGMSPRRIIVWAMTAAGLLAGLAGAIELLGITHLMTATYGGTTVGYDSIAVALLGRTSPIGIVLSGLLFGALRAGAPAMQIEAGVPAELVAVIQATILFFLVASPVVRRVFRLRGAQTGLEETGTFTKTYGGEAATR